jgi:hypothetical protein
MASGGTVNFVECVGSDGVFAIEILVWSIQVGATAVWSIGPEEVARQAFLLL